MLNSIGEVRLEIVICSSETDRAQCIELTTYGQPHVRTEDAQHILHGLHVEEVHRIRQTKVGRYERARSESSVALLELLLDGVALTYFHTHADIGDALLEVGDGTTIFVDELTLIAEPCMAGLDEQTYTVAYIVLELCSYSRTAGIRPVVFILRQRTIQHTTMITAEDVELKLSEFLCGSEERRYVQHTLETPTCISHSEQEGLLVSTVERTQG